MTPFYLSYPNHNPSIFHVSFSPNHPTFEKIPVTPLDTRLHHVKMWKVSLSWYVILVLLSSSDWPLKRRCDAFRLCKSLVSCSRWQSACVSTLIYCCEKADVHSSSDTDSNTHISFNSELLLLSKRPRQQQRLFI